MQSAGCVLVDKEVEDHTTDMLYNLMISIAHLHR
jgi:hypothetical protein